MDATIGVWLLIAVSGNGTVLSPESKIAYHTEDACTIIATHIQKLFPELLIGCEEVELVPLLGLSV